MSGFGQGEKLKREIERGGEEGIWGRKTHQGGADGHEWRGEGGDRGGGEARGGWRPGRRAATGAALAARGEATVGGVDVWEGKGLCGSLGGERDEVERGSRVRIFVWRFVFHFALRFSFARQIRVFHLRAYLSIIFIFLPNGLPIVIPDRYIDLVDFFRADVL